MKARRVYPVSQLEVRASSEEAEEWVLTGAAVCFGTVADLGWFTEAIAPGAFSRSLPKFLGTAVGRRRGFVGGMNHDWDHPIGVPTMAQQRGWDLYVEARLSKTVHAAEVRTLCQDQVVNGFSVGFYTTGRTWLRDLDEVQSWWGEIGYEPTAEDVAKAVGGLRRVDTADLWEFSPTVSPAYDGAEIAEARAQGEPHSGRSLEAHTAAVVSMVDEWCARLGDVAGRRAEDGRGLSAEHRSCLDRLVERLRAVDAGGVDHFGELRSVEASLAAIGIRLTGARYDRANAA